MAARAAAVRRYADSTVKTYLGHINRFGRHLNHKCPQSLEPADVKNYLTHLATVNRVSAATRNQAFNALLFLFRRIIGKELEGLADTFRAKTRRNLPVVLSRDEVRSILSGMTGVPAHLLEGGTDIRTLQDIRGHKLVETTMIYTHVIKDRFAGVVNPLDILL